MLSVVIGRESVPALFLQALLVLLASFIASLAETQVDYKIQKFRQERLPRNNAELGNNTSKKCHWQQKVPEA